MKKFAPLHTIDGRKRTIFFALLAGDVWDNSLVASSGNVNGSATPSAPHPRSVAGHQLITFEKG
jgi:hypothetical protein